MEDSSETILVNSDQDWQKKLLDSLALNIGENSAELWLFEQVSSTMDIYKNFSCLLDIPPLKINLKYGSEYFSAPKIYLSRLQNKGRGRNHKNWISGKDKGVYLTIEFDLLGASVDLSGYSLAIGVGLAECLKTFDYNIGLKWPNDLYSKDLKKLGGILVESRISGNQAAKIIVGVGLNVFSQNFLSELSATSLEDIGGKPNYFKIAASVISNIINTTECFLQKSFSDFLQRWNSLSVINGRYVSLSTSEKSVKVIRADYDGGLIIEVDSKIEKIYEGEVTLRV